MTRSEFISRLRGGLFGTLPESRIDDEVRYYENYIDGQVASGKSEQQVLEELGDPMLIARTIIAAADYSRETIDDGFGRETYREAYTDGYTDARQKHGKRTYTASYTDADGNTRYETGSGFLGMMKMLHRTGLLYVILVLILGIVAVVAVVGGIIYMLIPVLPILIVVWVVWKMLRGR